MRRRLGCGSHRSGGREIHRSSASRLLFKNAVRILIDGQDDNLSPTALWTALLQAPTELIKEVVAESSGEAKKRASTLSLLEEHATLITVNHEDLAASWKARAAEGKALTAALSEQRCRCVLLISDDVTAVRECVVHLADMIQQRACAPTLQSRRIYELRLPRPSQAGEENTLFAWRKILTGVQSANVILLLPALLGNSDRGLDKRWLEFLKQSFSAGLAQAIMRVTPAAYEEHIRGNAGWRSLSRAVWILDTATSKVPREL